MCDCSGFFPPSWFCFFFQNFEFQSPVNIFFECVIFFIQFNKTGLNSCWWCCIKMQDVEMWLCKFIYFSLPLSLLRYFFLTTHKKLDLIASKYDTLVRKVWYSQKFTTHVKMNLIDICSEITSLLCAHPAGCSRCRKTKTNGQTKDKI